MFTYIYIALNIHMSITCINHYINLMSITCNNYINEQFKVITSAVDKLVTGDDMDMCDDRDTCDDIITNTMTDMTGMSDI